MSFRWPQWEPNGVLRDGTAVHCVETNDRVRVTYADRRQFNVDTDGHYQAAAGPRSMDVVLVNHQSTKASQH